jgi:hypothetical protein
MAILTLEQRHDYYGLAAERTGIHKPILAALYQAHGSPSLAEGETGLGISPIHRISMEQVNRFEQQVQYAANTVRSLMESLVAQGWTGSEMWNAEHGRYTDQMIQAIASGYLPPASDSTVALLESCDPKMLLQAYLKEWETERQKAGLPDDLTNLDDSLLVFVERICDYYIGLPYQRDALLEVVRIGSKLDTREQAIASLASAANLPVDNLEESQLDIPLKQFIQRLPAKYTNYPYQREALIRLTQIWRQLPSREHAITTLVNNNSPEETLKIIDSALIAFLQRLPQAYLRTRSQRSALTEAYQLWHQLESRSAALWALGIDPQKLAHSTSDRPTLINSATQLDRALLEFVRRLPVAYQELDQQREILLRLVQLWRDLTTRDQVIESLFDDLKQMEQARRDTSEAPPPPSLLVLPKRPQVWTTENLQLFASIIPDGSLTWAEATRGGTCLPPNQATVDAIIRIADLAQRARDRLGRSFLIINWYQSASLPPAFSHPGYNRYQLGDAIDFTCEGLSGNQLYWFLDAWWPGGLGRYKQFPYVCYIDAQSYRIRWQH